MSDRHIGRTRQTERQRYRSSKERWRYQSVRLDHDDVEALRALAKRKRITVAVLIRTFITWGLENNYGGADVD